MNAGLCYKVSRIEKHAFPLSSYIDLKSFKIYMCDVGLLRKKAKLDAFIILSNDDNMYKEFKGAIAENFVLLELLSINDNLPYYWTSGNSAKLDFVWQLKDKILPIEVKSGKNIYAKGLSVYIDKYNPKLSIKISKRNLLKQNNIINIPLYLIWNIENII
ncbi:MAG: DUF4143 domain-containing protein [Clostridia bacterium]